MGTVMSATFLDTLSADFLGAVLVMPQPLPIPFTATSGVEQGPAESKVDAAILRSHASTSGLPFARPARSTFPSADQRLARELMRPPKYGGHSKRDKLGTIAESWGPDPSDPLRIGLFQHEPEPPSPTASPRPPSVDLSFK
jgi:hypothetical protein